jgi:cytochrome c oxidase assembly protein subunit 15
VTFHQAVENINRLVTGAVSVLVIVTVLASVLRVPRRRDLVVLSFGLVAGIIGQIVLGGLVVLSNLFPPLVMGHLVLSLLILWCALVLHHRAGPGGADADEPGHPAGPIDPSLRRFGRWLMAATGLVVVLGTVVTGSGPHAGSNGNQVVERLPFALHDAARVHGIAVMLLIAGTAAFAWMAVSGRAPRAVIVRVEVLLAVLVAQAGVGYTQYFTHLPVLLVGIHIAGAAAVWAAMVWLNLSLADPASVAAPARREPALVAG